MTENITIKKFETVGGRLRLSLLMGDGRMIAFHFSPEALVYRAAEFGVSPHDSVQLMDLVLHDGLADIPDDDPNQVSNTDAATALAYLKARITKVKKTTQIVDPDNILDPFHKGYSPNLDLYAQHVRHVANIRQERSALISSASKPTS